MSMLTVITWALLSTLIIPIGIVEFFFLRKGYRLAMALAGINVFIALYSWYRIIWAKQPLIEGIYGTAISFTGIIITTFAIVILGISGYVVSRPKGAWDANPKTLATTGPYKFARHPLYASEYLLIFSIALWQRAIWAIFLSPTLLGLAFIASWLEERHILTKNFPDSYKQYRRTTPRFFPWWFALLIVSIYLKILVYYLI